MTIHNLNLTPRPHMAWDSEDAWSSDGVVVWWTRVDGRYQGEVQRPADNNHKGRLVLFDRLVDDQLLLDEPVSLAFDAIFGPDVGDVIAWKKTILGVIDHRMFNCRNNDDPS